MVEAFRMTGNAMATVITTANITSILRFIRVSPFLRQFSWNNVPQECLAFLTSFLTVLLTDLSVKSFSEASPLPTRTSFPTKISGLRHFSL